MFIAIIKAAGTIAMASMFVHFGAAVEWHLFPCGVAGICGLFAVYHIWRA